MTASSQAQKSPLFDWIISAIGSVSALFIYVSWGNAKDAQALTEHLSRTKANLSTKDGLYEVRVEPYANKQTGTPDFITVKRAFNPTAKAYRYSVINQTMNDAPLLDRFNEANINNPEFKNAIFQASCQVVQSYINNPQKLDTNYPKAEVSYLLGTTHVTTDTYLAGAKNFYQSQCLNLK